MMRYLSDANSHEVVTYIDALAAERYAAVRERDGNSALADAAIDNATKWEVENVQLRAKLAEAEKALKRIAEMPRRSDDGFPYSASQIEGAMRDTARTAATAHPHTTEDHTV